MLMRVGMHGVEMSPSKEGIVAGGVQNSVFRLSDALTERGNSVSIITNDKKFRETGEPTTGFTHNDLDIYLTRVSGDYAGYGYALKYLYKTTLTYRNLPEIDIIHGHSGLMSLSIATTASKITTGMPAVHTIYCPPDRGMFNSSSAPLSRTIDRYIAISDNVAESLEEIGIPRSRIEVVHPVINYSKYRPGIGEGFSIDGVSDDEFVLLYFGNLTDFKQIFPLLDAMDKVTEEYENVRLVSGIELSNTGTEERARSFRNRVERYGLEDTIIELGLTRNVPELMDYSDAVVAPFKHTRRVADYPMTVMEAMAVGTPVITTPVGGIPEFVSDCENGLFVPPDNPDKLADSIIRLIQDPELRDRLSENSAKSIRAQFPPEVIAQQMNNVYMDIL